MRSQLRLLVPRALALLVVVSPSVAQACAVCFSGRSDEQREAFLATTVFLTFLPLALLGFAVWAFVRRVRQVEAENEVRGARAPHVALARD